MQLDENYPLPNETCEVCGKGFEYFPNPSWPAIKKFFSVNPSRVYWTPQPHLICDARKERDRELEKAKKMSEERESALSQAMADLGFAKLLADKPFEKFSVEDSNKKAYDAVTQWSFNEKGILLVGKPGRGKSHLLAGFGKKWMNNGINVAFQSMAGLMGLLRNGYNENVFDQRLELLSRRVQILILDDLGAEKATEWAEEKLYIIANTRLEAKLPLFVTTNCTEAELQGRYKERIISRLKGMCDWIEVGGKDWRVGKTSGAPAPSPQMPPGAPDAGTGQKPPPRGAYHPYPGKYGW